MARSTRFQTSPSPVEVFRNDRRKTSLDDCRFRYKPRLQKTQRSRTKLRNSLSEDTYLTFAFFGSIVGVSGIFGKPDEIFAKPVHAEPWVSFEKEVKRNQVPPRFELGSLDSESRVLTITPWNHDTPQVEANADARPKPPGVRSKVNPFPIWFFRCLATGPMRTRWICGHWIRGFSIWRRAGLMKCRYRFNFAQKSPFVRCADVREIVCLVRSPQQALWRQHSFRQQRFNLQLCPNNSSIQSDFTARAI